jgi:RNA 3'-terminal phosphate cyclase (ATP)
MITVDGSRGEGGGQILRSSLALSLLTGLPFRIDRIRAGRSKPGLLRQHLASVNAAAEVGHASVEDAVLGSQQLTFRPGAIAGGDFRFAVGSAGSATLVLQTILPALLRAPKPSSVTVEGGTHNPAAPPFDFLRHTFLPVLRRLGPAVDVELVRPGFYPKGGGIVRLSVSPAPLTPLSLVERGAVLRTSAIARVAAIPRGVAEREIAALQSRLAWPAESLNVEELPPQHGPGNVIVATVECEHVTEVVTGFGERGVSAETVAGQVVASVTEYLEANVPVGEHLADQLLLPMAMAGGGEFRTCQPSLHSTTQAETLALFSGVRVEFAQESGRVWRARVSGSGL